MVWRGLCSVPVVRLRDESGVVQLGDAERGVVDAVTLQAAVAQDLPALHSGQGVFDAGAYPAVGGVVFFLPGGQVRLTGLASVRDEQLRAAYPRRSAPPLPRTPGPPWIR